MALAGKGALSFTLGAERALRHPKHLREHAPRKLRPRQAAREGEQLHRRLWVLSFEVQANREKHPILTRAKRAGYNSGSDSSTGRSSNGGGADHSGRNRGAGIVCDRGHPPLRAVLGVRGIFPRHPLTQIRLAHGRPDCCALPLHSECVGDSHLLRKMARFAPFSFVSVPEEVVYETVDTGSADRNRREQRR